MQNVILTSNRGNNADLLASAFDLYAPKGAVIADLTYGKGSFWKKIDKNDYTALVSDIKPGFNVDARIDFRSLPYRDGSVDVVMLDPPYLSGGDTVVGHINKQYSCDSRTSHQGIIRRYAAGIVESARVLKKNGKLFVKCQDETVSGKQHFSHIELIRLLEMLGFRLLDLFVLTAPNTPCMRHDYQKSARKNHSYLIVGELRK
jgi:ParB family transcriptional regulator, chromosome partitioning protein